MMRQRQRAAARASGAGLARDIDIPLPIKGMLSEARTAEVSGLFAGELLNWKSTGASLELVSQYSVDTSGDPASQRIPFEFGASQEYINAIGIGLFTDGASITRDMSFPISVAYISSNAVLVDGSAEPVLYDGSAFSLASFTTSTAKSQNEFTGVAAHQDRLFFWEEGDDLDFYYADTVGAITGNLTRFPLGRLGNITGKIMAIRSLTMDAGQNINDALAIFTSTGAVVVYQGSNPGDANDWNQLARLKIAPPLSAEAFVTVGSDLWVLTAAGLVSVNQTINNSSMALVTTVSRPIQKKLIEQIAEGGEWSLHMSADATQIIIDRVYGGSSSQFIYATETKSWLETTYPAMSWHNLGFKTQFTDKNGHAGTLGEDGGNSITARWVTSWFRLPRSTGITYIRPTVLAKGPLTLKVTILSDHDETGVDISEAEQTVTIHPDDPDDLGGRVSLNEEIGIDAVGSVFQMRIEITASWAELVNAKAGVI